MNKDTLPHFMYRQPRSVISWAVAILSLLACTVAQSDENEQTARAIHERVITLDSHVDIARPYLLKPEFDPGQTTNMKVDLQKMQQGGLDAVVFIVYVAQGPRTPEGYAAAKTAANIKFDALLKMAKVYGKQIEIAYRAEDVTRIAAEGKKVEIIGIENGFVIGRDAHAFDQLDHYYQLGARYMGLTHTGNNDICDSSSASIKLGDKPGEHGGVSTFGRKVIARMNQLGMIVDVSHSSEQCMLQAIKLSRAPIIASHSGVKAMAESSRNLTDEQMTKLAESGGVMQLVAYSGFIKPDPARDQAFTDLEEQVRIEFKAEEFSYKLHEHTDSYQSGVEKINRDYPLSTVSDFVDQVVYAIKLMGIDHVGISSDFDGGGELRDWRDASETFNITRELLSRGFSEQDIAKIWSGNFLRVWTGVEKTAKAE